MNNIAKEVKKSINESEKLGKNHAVHHDDSDMIWFDYNDIDIDALETSGLSQFDIFNMPTYKSNAWGARGQKVPDVFELENYYVTFFKDHLSDTGYSCMCINKDRKVFKSKAGYDENWKRLKEWY